MELVNIHEQALIAEIETLEAKPANYQYPQPEIVKGEKNPRKKFKKDWPSKNLMQKQSPLVEIPAEKNNQQFAESSGIITPPPDIDYSISLWMNTHCNSVKNFKFYSEIWIGE